MRKIVWVVLGLATVGGLLIGVRQTGADEERTACKDVPSFTALQGALAAARAQPNGGFNLEMWGTVVNRDGVVCAVAFTGSDRGDQWPGSRVISA